MKHLILGAAMTAAITAPAFAQVPSQTASYSGQMQITGEGQTYTAKVYGAPMKSRMDMSVQGYTSVVIMDLAAKTALTYSPGPDSPMGQMAMRMDFSQASAQLGAQIDRARNADVIGTDTVAAGRCNVMQQDDVTACMTADGIIRRARDRDGDGMEMTRLARGPQSSSLFEVPAGYAVMDMNGLGGMFGEASQGQSDSTSAPDVEDLLGGLFGR